MQMGWSGEVVGMVWMEVECDLPKEERFRSDIGEIFHTKGTEVLTLLPREVWVPHPWRYSRLQMRPCST